MVEIYHGEGSLATPSAGSSLEQGVVDKLGRTTWVEMVVEGENELVQMVSGWEGGGGVVKIGDKG